MGFWGVEVKAGTPSTVNLDEGRCVHISQASLEVGGTRGEPVLLYVTTLDGNKRLIGTLYHRKIPQISFDLSFEEKFELSTSSREASVHFTGRISEVSGKEEKPLCCLDFMDNLATKQDVFRLCEKPSASPSTNDAFSSEKEDCVGLKYNSLFLSYTKLRVTTSHVDASADDIKKFFEEKLSLSVTPAGQSVENGVMSIGLVCKSNEELLMATKLNGDLYPNTECPLYIYRTPGRLLLFSVSGYDCSISESDLKDELSKIFSGCKNLLQSIVLHDETKPGSLVEICYLIFHRCQSKLEQNVMKLNSSLLGGKEITVRRCRPNFKYIEDHVKLKVPDDVGLSDSEVVVNPNPRSKKRSYCIFSEDKTGTDKVLKKSKRSSEKEKKVGDTSDSNKAGLDTNFFCKCCQKFTTKAVPTLLTKDDLKEVFDKWERKWPSKHDTWLDKRPDLMPSPFYRAKGVDCVATALGMHWHILARLSDCTTSELNLSNTISSISEGVPHFHRIVKRVEQHFIFARDFLIENEYIEDMKVHSRPEDRGEWDNFENVIDLLLAKAPLAVQINKFSSYYDHYSEVKDSVLSPTATERIKENYESLPTDALLLVGEGVDFTGGRPKRYFELLQPYQHKYGRCGIVRLARGEGLIKTAVEMTLKTKKKSKPESEEGSSGKEAGDTSKYKKAAASQQFKNKGKGKGKGRA